MTSNHTDSPKYNQYLIHEGLDIEIIRMYQDFFLKHQDTEMYLAAL